MNHSALMTANDLLCFGEHVMLGCAPPGVDFFDHTGQAAMAASNGGAAKRIPSTGMKTGSAELIPTTLGERANKYHQTRTCFFETRQPPVSVGRVRDPRRARPAFLGTRGDSQGHWEPFALSGAPSSKNGPRRIKRTNFHRAYAGTRSETPI